MKPAKKQVRIQRPKKERVTRDLAQEESVLVAVYPVYHAE
jgi:hypothetical protein